MSERMEKLHAIMEAEVTSYIDIGRQQERERIIKALKENYTNDEDDWAIDWAIDIVQKLGETK